MRGARAGGDWGADFGFAEAAPRRRSGGRGAAGGREGVGGAGGGDGGGGRLAAKGAADKAGAGGAAGPRGVDALGATTPSKVRPGEWSWDWATSLPSQAVSNVMRVFEEPAYWDDLPRGYTPPPHVAAEARGQIPPARGGTFSIPGQAEAEELVRALDGAIDGVTSVLDEKLGFSTGTAKGTSGKQQDDRIIPKKKLATPDATRGVVPAVGPASARSPLRLMRQARSTQPLDLRAELSRERLDAEANLAHLRHRCTSLEKENAFLRTQATAAEEQDPLVDQLMAQMSLLMTEKGRLAAENARLGAENRGLQELLAYTSAMAHDMTVPRDEAGADPPEALDSPQGPGGGEVAGESPFLATPPIQEGSWRASVADVGAGEAICFPGLIRSGDGKSGAEETRDSGVIQDAAPSGSEMFVQSALDLPLTEGEGLADISHVSESWSELGQESDGEAGEAWEESEVAEAEETAASPSSPVPLKELSQMGDATDEEAEAWLAD